MAANSDRQSYPFSLARVGYVFGYGVYSYYLKNFNADGYFQFPPQFTIEAWIKMGSVESAPDGLLMPIFGKYTSSDPSDEFDRSYKVGIAVSNYFIRVYVNSLSYDVDYKFGREPFWHYIGVSYNKL